MAYAKAVLALVGIGANRVKYAAVMGDAKIVEDWED